MNISSNVASVNPENRFANAFHTINPTDFGSIKVKLMDHEEGEGWSHEQVNIAETWYKRFLFLNVKYPAVPIVPNKVIDTSWHYHILDTRKYAEDCQNIFGHFFHHFPYFGMRGEEDAENLKTSFDGTKDIFLKEFGESLDVLRGVFSEKHAEVSTKCKAGNCRSCKGSVCKSAADDLLRPTFSS